MILNKVILGLFIALCIVITGCSDNKTLSKTNTTDIEKTADQKKLEPMKNDTTNALNLGKTLDNEDTIELKKETILFTTPDNFIIKGDYYDEGKCYPTVLLLPMLGHTKESYIPLISKLIDNKYNVLAIDMRGHGHSRDMVGSKGHSFKSFTKEDWEKLTLDVSAALKYLCEKKQNCTNIYIIGSSIGANTAIISGKKHPGKVNAVIGISPGLDFHGLKPIGYINNNKPTLLISAKDDEYSSESVEELKESNPKDITELIYPEGGHGTDLFETQPELIPTIIDWMEKNPPSTNHPKTCN